MTTMLSLKGKTEPQEKLGGGGLGAVCGKKWNFEKIQTNLTLHQFKDCTRRWQVESSTRPSGIYSWNAKIKLLGNRLI